MGEKIKVKVDEDLREIIPVFMKSRREDISELKKMLDEEQFKEIEKRAHRIKGAGGGYGFDRVTELGRKMEKAAGEKDRKNLEELIAEFAEYMERVEIVYE